MKMVHETFFHQVYRICVPFFLALCMTGQCHDQNILRDVPYFALFLELAGLVWKSLSSILRQTVF